MPSNLAWQGRPVYSVSLAAQAHGLDRDTMTRTLNRLPVQAIKPHPIGERAPLYWADEVDEAMAKRASATWTRAGKRTT